MTSREGGREKERERDLQHTGRVEFSVLHLGTELVKYTDETNEKKSTKSTKWNWNAINKRCIYMQMLKDNYAQKESEKQTCIIAWHSIMAKSCVSLFFCLLDYSRKVILNHRQLRFAGWVLLRCETLTLNLGMKQFRSSPFRVEQTLPFAIWNSFEVIDDLRADLRSSRRCLKSPTIMDGSSSSLY